MSTQRGNWQKKGPPKHANKKVFKNNMHDTSKQMQMLNAMDVTGVCSRCKDIIEWKIKYKKYKPLTIPKKCTKCGEKSVKRAYYITCTKCTKSLGICAKCGLKETIVIEPALSPAEEASQQSQLEQELKLLQERKRRTFLRLQASGKPTGEGTENTEEGSGGEESSDVDDESDDGGDSDANELGESEGHLDGGTQEMDQTGSDGGLPT